MTDESQANQCKNCKEPIAYMRDDTLKSARVWKHLRGRNSIGCVGQEVPPGSVAEPES